MKTNKLFRNSAIVTALLASLCCITPVLAILGGLSGIASTFSFLEPLRPYFIAFTAIILGYAFYNVYKPNKTEIDCDCVTEDKANKKSFINSKSFLWIVTISALILISFPYYSKVFFLDSQNIGITNSTHIVKAKLEIEGMSCSSCEQSVDYALKSENGVLSAESSYKTGIALVQFDDTKVQTEQLKRAIEEKVGYKVKKIQTIDENEN
ncbi:MAG: heavy metal transporter [Ignavibacteriales bacterium UTCHB2]|nr:MAG: heavy metal transporter [Ignavibacteriales bacterium UTCHB2]GJQ43421.1 MAG: hypothetical protein JETCAE03_29190 [Ignavibacteriaceae bacterium]